MSSFNAVLLGDVANQKRYWLAYRHLAALPSSHRRERSPKALRELALSEPQAAADRSQLFSCHCTSCISQSWPIVNRNRDCLIAQHLSELRRER